MIWHRIAAENRKEPHGQQLLATGDLLSKVFAWLSHGSARHLENLGASSSLPSTKVVHAFKLNTPCLLTSTASPGPAAAL